MVSRFAKKYLSNYRMLSLPPIDPATYKLNYLQGKNSNHFFKELQGDTIHAEHFIQELMRLIIPREPKTRVLYKDNDQPVGIILKEVEGFISLDNLNGLYLIYCLLAYKIKGLGEICAMLMITCERDAKLKGNVGVNSQNQVVKIDGNEAMFGMANGELSLLYPIDARNIERLPLPPSYVEEKGGNWFNTVDQKHLLKVFWLLSFYKTFRDEVNSTLLRFFMLPEICYRNLLDQTIPEESIKFQEQFLERQNLVQEAALRSPSFCRYLQTDKPKKEMQKFFSHLNKFTLAKKCKLAELSQDDQNEVLQKLQQLKPSREQYKPSFYTCFRTGIDIAIGLLSLVMFIMMLRTGMGEKELPYRNFKN